jgi:hypothetical protein
VDSENFSRSPPPPTIADFSLRDWQNTMHNAHAFENLAADPTGSILSRFVPKISTIEFSRQVTTLTDRLIPDWENRWGPLILKLRIPDMKRGPAAQQGYGYGFHPQGSLHIDGALAITGLLGAFTKYTLGDRIGYISEFVQHWILDECVIDGVSRNPIDDRYQCFGLILGLSKTLRSSEANLGAWLRVYYFCNSSVDFAKHFLDTGEFPDIQIIPELDTGIGIDFYSNVFQQVRWFCGNVRVKEWPEGSLNALNSTGANSKIVETFERLVEREWF